MLKYTLCLIKQGNKILLLNREKPAWMGCWNGVGGKIEKGENPRESALREILEETSIKPQRIAFKGLMTWSNQEGGGFGGLYLYMAEVCSDHVCNTPLKTREGILDWKEIDWILHPDNLGVSSNLPGALHQALQDEAAYDYHSIFSGIRMIEQKASPIDPAIEFDEEKRNLYLKKYFAERDASYA